VSGLERGLINFLAVPWHGGIKHFILLNEPLKETTNDHVERELVFSRQPKY
jgi:hypothetical protein